MSCRAILCNVVGRDGGRFVAEAEAEIARSVELPTGYTVDFRGDCESQQRTMQHDLRRGGMPLHDAVIEGLTYRFRPILMTELVLILGVLPLALGTTTGSEIHRPLAVVHIGGFVAAIFLEQIVLPILYELFARRGKDRVAAA